MNASEFHSSRKFVATPFGRVAYVERGSGPAALLLHGLPLCGYAWRGVLEDLAPLRRAIALDLLGLGYSEAPAGQDVSFAAQARTIAAFLDAMGLDAVDLVANDTGGGIGQIFAALHPGRVRTLTLTNCEVHDLWPNALLAGFYEGVQAGVVPQAMKQMLDDLGLARRELGALVYEDPEFFTADAVRVYLAPIVASATRIEQFQRLCDWKANRAQLVEVAPRLRASKIRTRILWSVGDVVFDAEPSLRWLESNLGAIEQITRIPRAKLFFPEEQPRRVSEFLREFWGEDTAEVMRKFNDVFQKHDPSALSDLVAEDCVIENTVPAPDGSRHVGRDACVALWREIATAPGTGFDLEDVAVAGDRAVIRWRFRWGTGPADSVRGVNLMRVRGGKIVEALGYVKGRAEP